MEIFEIKKQVEEIKLKLQSSLYTEDKILKISQLEKKTMEQDFWTSSDKDVILKQISQLKNELEIITKINELYENIYLLIELIELENDTDSIQELNETFNQYLVVTADYSNKVLLNGQYDYNDAIITINAGAGGTEACDWVSMLYRMYDRYSQKKALK